VSFFDPETGVASCGDLSLSASFDMHFCIVDKDGLKRLVDGVAGEIMASGRALVTEYWNNPEASKAFGHTIEGYDKKMKWYTIS
jgi:acyl-CoA synthetase (AMP-forming)/AMP-acid ligase II